MNRRSLLYGMLSEPTVAPEVPEAWTSVDNRDSKQVSIVDSTCGQLNKTNQVSMQLSTGMIQNTDAYATWKAHASAFDFYHDEWEKLQERIQNGVAFCKTNPKGLPKLRGLQAEAAKLERAMQDTTMALYEAETEAVGPDRFLCQRCWQPRDKAAGCCDCWRNEYEDPDAIVEKLCKEAK